MFVHPFDCVFIHLYLCVCACLSVFLSNSTSIEHLWDVNCHIRSGVCRAGSCVVVGL